MGGLITVVIVVLVVWVLCGILVTAMVADSDSRRGSPPPGLWDVLAVLTMCVTLGPFAFVLFWLLNADVQQQHERDQRQRRRWDQQRQQAELEEQRAQRRQYVLSRQWQTTEPQELELLEGEYQHLVQQQEDEPHAQQRRRERAILRELRAEQRRRPSTTPPTSTPDPPPRNWREERPLFWRDR